MLAALLGSCTSEAPDRSTDRQLAETYCTGCHAFPEPDLLSARVWRKNVLPLMGAFLGVPGTRVLNPTITENFPSQPQLTPGEWAAIQQWYVDLAPDTLPSAARGREEIAVGLRHFTTHLPEGDGAPPMTTLVRIDTAGRRVVYGEGSPAGSRLHFLNPATNRTESIGIGRPLADLDFAGDTLYLTALGEMIASDEPWGALEILTKEGRDGSGHYGPAQTLIPNLQRPVRSLRHDVDQDGDPDWIIAEFGKYAGRLSWFENDGGNWTRHSLIERSGAVHLQLTDHDGDGRQDLLVAFGQGDERISLFSHDAGGHWRERRLIEFPPTNGTVHFQLADFDGDGREDILYVNGDNADYKNPGLKPYHGYTIYLRGRGATYTAAYHFPANGAYGARVADFDLDGDLDFATVAFYPDFSVEPRESFIYFENTGGVGGPLTFVPSTLTDYRSGRFLVLDSGDVDGDGDEDIVLGSYVGFSTEHDRSGLHENWVSDGPPVIWLENTVR